MAKILITFQRGSHVFPRVCEGVVLMTNLLWAETTETHTRNSDPWYRIIEYRPCPRGLETSPPILKWRQERAQSLSVIPRIQSLHMYV